MAKHEEHEEHENHERWLVSYADFITLLFAFFVVMYSLSQTDQKRAIAVEQSVRWALHVAGNGGGGDRILLPNGSLNGARSTTVVPNAPEGSAVTFLEKLRARAARKIGAAAGEARPSVLVMLDGSKLIVRVSARGLFEEGAAELRPSALMTLDAILEEVRQMSGDVQVEGHTDTSPAAGGNGGNWLLSAERAAAVVAYIERTHALPSERLSIAGYGSLRPVADNSTEAGRAANRRIDIVVQTAK